MSNWFIIILVLSLAMIIGGILLLKKSAKKFHLTETQLNNIKQRNQQLDNEDQQE